MSERSERLDEQERLSKVRAYERLSRAAAGADAGAAVRAARDAAGADAGAAVRAARDAAWDAAGDAADEIIYLDDSKCPACERDEFRIDKPLILLLLGALALFGVVLLGLWKLTELVYPILRGL